MWAHRHYTLFSGTADSLWVLQTEGRPAKAARFDNWELYKFPKSSQEDLKFFSLLFSHCVFLKSCVQRPHCEGDKSFDINLLVKVKGIQSSAQEEEPLIACFAPALLSSVLQIKQQRLHTQSICLWILFAFDYSCLLLMFYCAQNKLVWLLCQELRTSASAMRSFFLLICDGQTRGFLHLKHHCFCQEPQSKAGRATLISSIVLCFFFSPPPLPNKSHGGTCVYVCVWDAGMHGVNPPLSATAWTVGKTLLLLFPSMLIRRGWRCGGAMVGCANVIQGWHPKIHDAPLVTGVMHLADL